MVQELQRACKEVAELEQKSCDLSELMEKKLAEAVEDNEKQLERMEGRYVDKLAGMAKAWERRFAREKEDRKAEVAR
ncbi:unnamed protein product, partial [Amoebophrya sp. A25]|eukprot:GSA25T00001556001.1